MYARHFSRALSLATLLVLLPQPVRAESDKCKVTVLAHLPVVMENSRASVPVSFNGRDSRVWLDSGAFFNFMPKAKAAELGLTTTPLPNGFYVKGIGGTFTPELTRVRDFGLLGATLHNMEFIVGGTDSGNGFLGANLLGLWDSEFDLAKGSVKLIRESGCAKVNMAYWGVGMSVGEAHLLRGDDENDRHIYVEVFVNGHPLRALLDSGAPTSIINRHAAERAGINLSDPRVVASQMMGGVGSHLRASWIARTETITIGGEEIRNSPIRVIDDTGDDRSTDMLLGVDFLMAHHVLVSQPQRIMFLTYNGGAVFSSSTDGETGHQSKTLAKGMGASEHASDPTTADGFAGRGSGRLHAGDVSGAIADFSQAIHLAPARADLLTHRATAYFRDKHPELAAKDIDAALALTPNDHKLLVRRAWLRLGKDDKPGALSDLDAAAAVTPKGSLDVMGVVDLYERLGMADRGLALIDPVVELHREDASLPELLNARSWNRALANTDLDRALKDINLALRKAGPNPAMLDTRALVQLRRKDYAAAIADESAALDASPKLAAALFTRGLARLASGDQTGGAADIASARELRPHVDRPYALYGLVAPGAKPSSATTEAAEPNDLDEDS